MNGVLQRALKTFAAFTPGQKAVTVLALVGLLVGGVLVSQWAARPSYAPLFTGLAAEDASAIVEQLNSAGTPYQLADGGSTILVPRETVYDTRIAMSGEGLPAGDGGGYSLLDQQSVTSSEFQQQIAYRRALEGELTKTIQSIDGVEVAVVHLAIPEKDVFTRETDKPTASVLVDTAPGKDLTSGQVQAVLNLVSSSVEGMVPESVTVADSSGRVLSNGTEGGIGALGDSRAERTREYEERLASEIETMLDQVVGRGGSVVKVTADLDFDRTETRTDRYEPNPDVPPLAESTTEERYEGAGGTATGGVLGPDNIQVPAGAAGDSTYEKTQETRNNAVTKVTEMRESAPGAVNGLDVAVLLNTRTAGAANRADVQRLVASAVGIDPQRGDTLQVTDLPFDESAAEAAAAELAEARTAEESAARANLLKTAGLVLLVVAVLGYAVLSGRRRRRAQLTDAERIQLERLQQSLELQAARERAELDAAAAAVASIEPPKPVDPKVEAVALARDEITEMVQKQPEEVAQVLRAWLADRRA